MKSFVELLTYYTENENSNVYVYTQALYFKVSSLRDILEKPRPKTMSDKNFVKYLKEAQHVLQAIVPHTHKKIQGDSATLLDNVNMDLEILESSEKNAPCVEDDEGFCTVM